MVKGRRPPQTILFFQRAELLEQTPRSATSRRPISKTTRPRSSLDVDEQLLRRVLKRGKESPRASLSGERKGKGEKSDVSNEQRV